MITCISRQVRSISTPRRRSLFRDIAYYRYLSVSVTSSSPLSHSTDTIYLFAFPLYDIHARSLLDSTAEYVSLRRGGLRSVPSHKKKRGGIYFRIILIYFHVTHALTPQKCVPRFGAEVRHFAFTRERSREQNEGSFLFFSSFFFTRPHVGRKRDGERDIKVFFFP